MTDTKPIPERPDQGVRPVKSDVPMDPRYTKREVDPEKFAKLVEAPMEQG